MTSNHHAPYDLGYTRATMDGTEGSEAATKERVAQSTSEFGLEAAIRLHEAGIASNRGSECRGEYVPGPCTHRPSHHESREHPKPVRERLREPAAEGGANDWGEGVTR